MLEHLVCSNVMAQFEEHNILNDKPKAVKLNSYPSYTIEQHH